MSETNQNPYEPSGGRLDVQSLTARAKARCYSRLLLDDIIALPTPPDIEEYGVLDPFKQHTQFEHRDLIEVSMAIWDQYAQMLGLHGQGYSSLKQLRDALFERERELIHKGSQRLKRHAWAQEAMHILREESRSYGEEGRIGNAERLTEPRSGWLWEDRGLKFFLSIGSGNLDEDISELLRTFRSDATWSGSMRRISNYLLDEDAYAKDRAEAELLYYRQDIIGRLIQHYETFGHAPLFFAEGDGANEEDTVPARSRLRERTLEHSREKLRQQHWAFIRTAREVILCQDAVTSMSAVFDAVDGILKADPNIDWGGGRARKYAGSNHLNARRKHEDGKGETQAPGQDANYRVLKERVLELYGQWVEEGFSPVELSCR